MTSPWLYALTVGPLGFYFWTLALWHSYRHPRVVSGLADYGLLTFGVGGVVVFGPIGQLLVRGLFRNPDVSDWLAVASALGLFACLGARRALNRLVVYHVDPATLHAALGDVLPEFGGPFSRTLGGYEDIATGRGLRVDTSPRLRSAVVEAHGRGSEELIQLVRPRLRRRLAAVPAGQSPVAAGFYGLSIAVMLAPLVVLFLAQPRARQALRVLIERLRGV